MITAKTKENLHKYEKCKEKESLLLSKKDFCKKRSLNKTFFEYQLPDVLTPPSTRHLLVFVEPIYTGLVRKFEQRVSFSVSQMDPKT